MSAAILQSQPVRAGAVTAAAGIVVALVAWARLRLVVVAAAFGCAAGAAAMATHLAALHRGPVAAFARDGGNVEMQLTLVRDPIEVRSSTGRAMTVVDATAI